ncbi:MAG TPA: hypothetical protein VFR06_07050 [Gallionellaceae bacterium]|nr:hypothetical protein [Gallionellaceae bacterium]
MEKFWMYFKKAMLVWGFIWLAIVLLVGGLILFERVVTHQSLEQIEQQKDEGFKKKVGDIELKAVRDVTDPERMMISLYRGNTPMVTDYELPAKEFNLQWVDINKADVIPTGNGRYRIILQGGSYDCDQESSHYIWMLHYDGEMTLVKMLTLFGMHEVAGRADRLFANEILQLPEFDEESLEQIVIPIELELGATVKVSSMLSHQSNELMSQHFGKIIDERMIKLAKKGDTKLLAKYEAASAALKEALGKQAISP